MNELLNKIAAELKTLGLREFGVPIWVKDGEQAKYAGVTASVTSNKVNGTTINSLQLPLAEGGFVSVRLGKGVAPNKASFDIFMHTAVRDFPSTEQEKVRFPNVTPIKKGDKTAFAF